MKPGDQLGWSMPRGTIYVSLGPIDLDGDYATVGVEWFLSGTGGAGYEYCIAREGGTWQVIIVLLLWIS